MIRLIKRNSGVARALRAEETAASQRPDVPGQTQPTTLVGTSHPAGAFRVDRRPRQQKGQLRRGGVQAVPGKVEPTARAPAQTPGRQPRNLSVDSDIELPQTLQQRLILGRDLYGRG
ncbi:MAG: hypothetical protein ACLFVU_06710 [Phycisphaerae bacterium]